MELFTKVYVRMLERKGQSMTEYALIMAAIAVAAFAAYNSLGKGIVSILTNVTGSL